MEYLLGIVPLTGNSNKAVEGAGNEVFPIPALPRGEEREVKPPRVLTFDIETQRGADEVGGWNQTHLMRVAAAVVHDSTTGQLVSYLEKDIPRLLDDLKSADLVVGFNVKRFDYGVLRGYTDFDFSFLPTFDLLEDIHRRLGFRLSLDHLAKHTLNLGKTADGLQALRWFKEGKIDLIVEYCKNDVMITRSLFDFAMKNKHLIYQRKNGPVVQLPLEWDLEQILSSRPTAAVACRK